MDNSHVYWSIAFLRGGAVSVSHKKPLKWSFGCACWAKWRYVKCIYRRYMIWHRDIWLFISRFMAISFPDTFLALGLLPIHVFQQASWIRTSIIWFKIQSKNKQRTHNLMWHVWVCKFFRDGKYLDAFRVKCLASNNTEGVRVFGNTLSGYQW